MFETLAQLYVNGVRIDWPGFERDYGAARQRVSLPTYPFEHKSYWWTEGSADRSAARPVAQRWESVIEAGRRQAQQAPLDLALHTYADRQRCLEELATAYINNTLCDLGAFARAGEAHSIDSLLAQFKHRADVS